jgi:hypothetical protein
VVGELAELEADEAVAAEDDPGQRRGQRLDRLDAAGEEGAVAGASPLWGSRSDDASFVR